MMGHWKNLRAGPILPLLRRKGVVKRTSPTLAQERNDDDDIDKLQFPSPVFDPRNPTAWRQPLARDLLLQTNVTRRHTTVSQNQ